ncbi:MAG: fibronectin type III domain-containing protein [Gammaproteobacteria bacterium]|nr:fibronectin type III domain-containing protein [Gammaproteobacteria bacterium]
MVARSDEPVSEFAELGILVEQNATDGDTEIVITAVPDTDQGLKRFAVRTPDKRLVLAVRSPARVMGLRELLFETPEPEGEQILSVYPEGRYKFRGIAEDGERFFGTARLSHRLPHPTMIIHPASGQEVPADSLTIQWSQVPGIEQFLLEFENESADPEQSLTINLPPDVTSFEVPPSLLIPGADYQVGVATIARNGNIVFVEVEFSTAD